MDEDDEDDDEEVEVVTKAPEKFSISGTKKAFCGTVEAVRVKRCSKSSLISFGNRDATGGSGARGYKSVHPQPAQPPKWP